jgi:hypothetical protein
MVKPCSSSVQVLLGFLFCFVALFSSPKNKQQKRKQKKKEKEDELGDEWLLRGLCLATTRNLETLLS